MSYETCVDDTVVFGVCIHCNATLYYGDEALYDSYNNVHYCDFDCLVAELGIETRELI